MYVQLSRSPLFRGVTPEEIDLLLKKVQYRIKSFVPEQQVASRGTECSSLMILLEGSVRGEMIDFSGKTLKIEDVVAPKPIAIGFLFGQENNYPVDVIANSDVTLLILPKEEVMKLFKANTFFLSNFLNAVSNRAQFLSRRIWFLSFKTIKGKLAHYILSLAGDTKKTVQIPVQRELADFFGVTRPSLARALGEMEKDGCIKVDRKDITILDKKMLIKLLE